MLNNDETTIRLKRAVNLAKEISLQTGLHIPASLIRGIPDYWEKDPEDIIHLLKLIFIKADEE